MKLTDFWEKLEPQPETLETLKKDLKEGKPPELPYFIVDLQQAKKAIAAQLEDIDKERMLTNMIISQYGNGKTNLLKYLQLFFNNFKEGNINVLYSRADVEQPDLILFLLKIIQDNFTQDVIEAIKIIRTNPKTIPKLANDFKDNFSSIKEYANKLFETTLEDEKIKKIIYLGTGRLYTKGHFKEFDLDQLTNFNRRETLVLFLNILAQQNTYLIFAIDEVEKIQEKSKLRFNQFLTSYRELIDLFNKIKGHYLITCFTDASDRNILQETNNAFYTRIEPDIQKLPPISTKEDIEELLSYLNDLFETKREEVDLDKISFQLRKVQHQKNRDLLRHAIELLLHKEETLSLKNLLKNYHLENLYNQTYEKLRLEDSLKSLNQKFFDPLENYLIANFLLDDTSKIDRRDSQSFIDEINNKVHMFIFNENSTIQLIDSKVNILAHKHKKDIIIYSPVLLELSNASISIDDEEFVFTIVDYNPEEFFVLLNMFRDNFEFQTDISKVITAYTKNYL